MRKLPLILVAFLAPFLLTGIHGLAAQRGGQDPGVPVQMFESSNLDRFLRKAQDFLGRQDYGNAIKVLQNIVEGRTNEFVAEEPGGSGKASKEEPKRVPRNNAANNPRRNPRGNPRRDPRRTSRRGSGRQPTPVQGPGNWSIDQDNPAYSVFSVDDRLYRPVARLCHELLASLPETGVGLYRARFGFQAETEYKDALKRRDLDDLEAVYNKYFITKHAGLAMEAAADLLMDRGRFRSSVQTLDTLLHVYPEYARREAGLVDLMLWVKLATCYEQLGESRTAAEILEQTAARWSEASVRVMGELYPVAALAKSELFGSRNVATDTGRPSRGAAALALALPLASRSLRLVPMWETRFTDPNPYGRARTRGNQRPYVDVRTSGGGVPTGFPRLNDGKPGTSVLFLDRSIVFKDHYRLVVRDLRSGLLQANSGTIDDVLNKTPDVVQRRPKTNYPRARLPIYDHFGQRVTQDADRLYVMEGSRSSATNNMKVITNTRLIAYDRKTGAQIWSSDEVQIPNKYTAYRHLSFCAVPTVFRKFLLVPFMERGAYGVLCMDSATGQQVYRIYMHTGGTKFARAPSAPVKMNSGVAYVLTNAGVVSAIAAHTGELLWHRKYERAHPTRFKRRRRGIRNRGMGFGIRRQISPVSIDGFLPAPMEIVEDRVIFSPADGKMLLCLDGASGKPIWMLSKSPGFGVATMKYVVGRDQNNLYVMCDGGQLLCVDFRTGIRKWTENVPGASTGSSGHRGRGLVTDDAVLLPGTIGGRRLDVLSTKGKRRWRTFKLPRFTKSKAPLPGPFNLQMQGAYLAACYEGGIEVYSSIEALEGLAAAQTDPEEKAAYLMHARDLEGAFQQLLAALSDSSRSANARGRLAKRALRLAGEVSLAYAKKRKRQPALAVLDSCKSFLQDTKITGAHSLKLGWHLARLEVFRALSDGPNIEREQDIIELGGGRK